MIHDREQVTLDLSADECIAGANTSMSLGLIVTELVINTLKHAFPDGRSGKIWMRYHVRGQDWILSVTDDGIGMPAASGVQKSGLGTSIVQALAQQIGATIATGSANPGTVIFIEYRQASVLAQSSAGRERASLVA